MECVDALLITHQRPELFRKSLESLKAAVDAEPRMRVLLHVGVVTTDTASKQIVNQFRTDLTQGSRLTVEVHLQPSNDTPAQRRNLLLPFLKSEWVFLYDDDAFVPAGYFTTAVEHLHAHPQLHVFGGPNLTPPESSPFQTACGAVLASWWGAGPASARYRAARPHEQFRPNSLILCNMWVPRAYLTEYRFRPRLNCGEEIDFMLRLSKEKISFRHLPSLPIWHQRRETLKGFLSQIFKYGGGRGHALSLTGIRACDWIFFVPFFSALASFGWVMNSLFSSLELPWAGALLHTLYLAGTFGHALVLSDASQPRPKTFLWAVFLFPAVHLLYACGLASGFVVAWRGFPRFSLWSQERATSTRP